MGLPFIPSFTLRCKGYEQSLCQSMLNIILQAISVCYNLAQKTGKDYVKVKIAFQEFGWVNFSMCFSLSPRTPQSSFLFQVSPPNWLGEREKVKG
jgi:hypothetical protein